MEALRRELARIEEDRARVEAELASADGLIEHARERASLLFRSAGLSFDPDLSIDRQLEAAAAAAARSARHELLQAELMPAAVARLLQARARAEVVAEIEALGGNGSISNTEPFMETPSRERGLAEIDSEIAEAHDVQDRLAQTRAKQGAQYEERARRCNEERADKVVERHVVTRAIEQAVRFKRAIDLARGTIEDVAWNTHRRWAEFLNHRVGEILARFGAEIADVRFGDDLDFSLRLPSGTPTPRGRALFQLSSGVRDQLHLAVRIAVSEFLSPPGVPLPLLLDDCFVTSDDERTRAAMKLLMGTSPWSAR